MFFFVQNKTGKKQANNRYFAASQQGIIRRKNGVVPENRRFSGVLFRQNRLYPLINKGQKHFYSGILQVDIRCLSGQYQVLIRSIVLQDQDFQARSAALRSPAPVQAPSEHSDFFPGAASVTPPLAAGASGRPSDQPGLYRISGPAPRGSLLRPFDPAVCHPATAPRQFTIPPAVRNRYCSTRMFSRTEPGKLQN